MPDAPSFISAFSAQMKKLFAPRQDASIKEAIEEAIEEVLEEHGEQDGAQLPPEEETMLRNVLSFGDLTVGEIMIPRTDIVAVPVDIASEEMMKHVIEQGHTRVPVYRETLDTVEGFLHVKDLFPVLCAGQPFDLARLMRPVLFVPPSMKIIDLLVKLRRQASHMAIVVDEYGGTDGLVTLEDVFEEIVGDIQDEHDDEDGPRELTRIDEGIYDADARIRIDKLERALGVNFSPEPGDGENFDTLAGLIFFEAGRVPAKGEKIPHVSGLTFEILEADSRRIKRVRVARGADEVASFKL